MRFPTKFNITPKIRILIINNRFSLFLNIDEKIKIKNNENNSILVKIIRTPDIKMRILSFLT